MVSSTAIDATTGTNRWAVSVRSTAAFTWIDLAHEPEVGRALLASQQQPAVHPGQPHRRHAAGDERGHHVGVELAGQDHRGDVERLGVGDADPVDERRLDAEPLGHLGHLRAAAVHDDRA